jgi:hypothetical protein
MDTDAAQMLRSVQCALLIARARQRRRWRRKVCTIFYREEEAVFRLKWYAAQLEWRVRVEQRRMAGD